MSEPETEAEPSFDPTRRKLCADGSCVGVLGDDGRCKVCGRTEAQAAAGDDWSGPDEAGASGGGAGGGGVEGESAGGGGAGGVAGGFDSKRRLCDDGSCVGVVGDDGVCRVCGRRSQ
jgi:hypothetical protein